MLIVALAMLLLTTLTLAQDSADTEADTTTDTQTDTTPDTSADTTTDDASAAEDATTSSEVDTSTTDDTSTATDDSSTTTDTSSTTSDDTAITDSESITDDNVADTVVINGVEMSNNPADYTPLQLRSLLFDAFADGLNASDILTNLTQCAGSYLTHKYVDRPTFKIKKRYANYPELLINSTLLAKNTSAELYFCTGVGEEGYAYFMELMAYYGTFGALSEAFGVNVAGVAIESQQIGSKLKYLKREGNRTTNLTAQLESAYYYGLFGNMYFFFDPEQNAIEDDPYADPELAEVTGMAQRRLRLPHRKVGQAEESEDSDWVSPGS